MRASLFPTVDSAPFLSQVLTITVCSGWPRKCGHKGGIWDELINIVSLLKRVLGYSCISNLITDNMKQSHLYLQPRTPKSHPIAQSAKWQGNTFAPSDLYQKLLAGRMRNPTKQKKRFQEFQGTSLKTPMSTCQPLNMECDGNIVWNHHHHRT